MRPDMIRLVVASAGALVLTATMATAVRANAAYGPLSSPTSAHPATVVGGGSLIHTGERSSQPSCPPSDRACYVISKGSPATDTWCISRSNNCTSGLYGKQRWSAEVLNCSTGSCVRTDRVKATWDPKKGNPSTETISTKQKKATKGYTYQVIFMDARCTPAVAIHHASPSMRVSRSSNRNGSYCAARAFFQT